MRIELDKNALGINKYATPRLGHKPCWDAMQTIGLLEEEGQTGIDEIILRTTFTGKVCLYLGQGGVRSKRLGKNEKLFLKEHLHLINEAHPEIPKMPTGLLHLHYAEGVLRKVVFEA